MSYNLKNKWCTWWARSQRGLGIIPQKCPRHHRLIVELPPDCQKIKLTFSGFYETQKIQIKNAYCYGRDKEKYYPITFQTSLMGEIEPQESIICDEINLEHISQSQIVIEYEIVTPQNYDCVSGFERMEYDPFVDAPQQIYGLQRIDVISSFFKGCVVAFGDSLLEQGYYAKIIKQELLKEGYSFINLGLSGNRLLRKIESIDLLENEGYQNIYTDISIDKQFFGMAGIERFEREVLACQNRRLTLIAIGINDIYQPGTFCAKLDELPTVQQLQTGYLYMERSLQESVLWCAITPFIHNKDWSMTKERVRLEINEWLVKSFQYSISLDTRLHSDLYFQEDGLHLNALGGQKLAEEMMICFHTLLS